jgi:hypothetical protein
MECNSKCSKKTNCHCDEGVALLRNLVSQDKWCTRILRHEKASGKNQNRFLFVKSDSNIAERNLIFFVCQIS